jgi:hypothetical protein
VFGVPFNDVVDLCETLGLLKQIKGYRVSRVLRKASTVRATTMLAGYLPPFPGWQDLQLVAPELLQLREPDERGNKQAVPYRNNTHYARAWRRDIGRINDMLVRSGVALNGQAAWLEPDRNGLLRQVITTQHVAMYRVFNNASWKQGGRLFGGWWQNMRKRDRLSRIFIAGEPVTELDWSTLFLRLAYRNLEVPWPFDGRDAYCDDANKRTRDGYKRMTNALLQAARPLRRWPGRTPAEQEQHRDYFAPGTTASSVYNFIRARHASVAARAFGCGLGHRLQRVESDMLVDVLLELDGMNVPALPEHDSVLVRASQVNAAREVMERVAHKHTGLLLSVKVESSAGPLKQHELLARYAGAPLVRDYTVEKP